MENARIIPVKTARINERLIKKSVMRNFIMMMMRMMRTIGGGERKKEKSNVGKVRQENENDINGRRNVLGISKKMLFNYDDSFERLNRAISKRRQGIRRISGRFFTRFSLSFLFFHTKCSLLMLLLCCKHD